MRPLVLLAVLATLMVALPFGPTSARTDLVAAEVTAFPLPPGYAQAAWRDLGPTGLGDAQNDDLLFELSEVVSAFGPESYKTQDLFNTRNPNDLDNQTTDWDAALGHHIEFLVNIEGAAGVGLPCDTRFEPVAYIPLVAGGQRLYGWTNGTTRTEPPSPTAPCAGIPGVRAFRMFFDLDGAPNTAAPSEPFPALATGGAIATLELYYTETPSPTNPTGRGPLAGTYEVAFTLFNPVLNMLNERVMRFPDSVFRMFTDVGPGTDVNMPMRAIRPPTNLTDRAAIEMRFPGAPVGTAFEVTGWYAARTGPGAQPPNPVPTQPETPIPGAVDKVIGTDDRSVQLASCEFAPENAPSTVPVTGVFTLQFSQFCRGSPDAVAPDHWPLNVIATHIPANLTSRSTGVGTLVVPLSDRVFDVRGLKVNTVAGAPLSGATELTLLDSGRIAGGPAGTNAGDLFALRVTGLGHEAIAAARMARDANAQWVRGSVPHLAFTEVSQYDLVALLYAERDEFLGMTVVRRGLDLSAQSIQVVKDKEGSIPVTLRSVTTDFDEKPGEADLTLTVQLTAVGGPIQGGNFSDSKDVGEDSSASIGVPVRSSSTGDFTVKLMATAGELTQGLDVTVQVVKKAAEDKRWYSPAPAAPFAILALLAVAAFLARRR